MSNQLHTFFNKLKIRLNRNYFLATFSRLTFQTFSLTFLFPIDPYREEIDTEHRQNVTSRLPDHPYKESTVQSAPLL